MSVMLFIIVVIASFIIVRIGAIAFQLTGLEWSLAKFQSLSCFSGTGFTTREAELVTGHPQRRRIATVLIVLGNAGFITMIASVASAMNAQYTLWAKLSESLLPIEKIPPYLIRYINLLIIILSIYIMYKLSSNEKLAKKLTTFLRIKIIKKKIFKPVSFEELLMLAGGYGVSKIDVSSNNPLVNKTLAQSDLRKSDITVLAIVRSEETIPNPPAGTKILAGDELISFGQLENIRKRCIPKKERIAK
jgi:K+/H+ antiporter YhaU regulatory subunit KhtT